MSTQIQTQARPYQKSSDALTTSAAVRRHLTGQREFSAHERSLTIQTKLRIGRPGDKYEQEAERIANEVMRMPDTSVQLKYG